MTTFETSFICDGQIVFGKENTCLTMTSKQATKHRPDTQLPQGWIAVLLAGDSRRELCPRCAKVWRDQVIARTLPLPEEEIAAYRLRCQEFDWHYLQTDDHGYWKRKDEEFTELQRLARTNTRLQRVFAFKGRDLEHGYDQSSASEVIGQEMDQQKEAKEAKEMSREEDGSGYTFECLCEVCGRQFKLPHSRAPHRCGCDKSIKEVA